jgi:ABC-2 type transport system ATP-binding protein
MAATTTSSVMLRVEGLTKSFGRLRALEGVSFDVRAGEIVGLIGPNGAGKTTVLECVAGIQPADSMVRGFGASPRAATGGEDADIFYVPDAISPWPDQTVEWALRYFVELFGGSLELREQELRDQVESELELGAFLKTRIGVLSKGQRKRFLLALGLLAPHALVVIDEPFDGLDLRQSREVEKIFQRHRERRKTFLLSIHQIADAERLCDRFILLSAGRVAAQGTLSELEMQSSASRSASGGAKSLEEIFLALT